MEPTIRSFEDLIAWQKARALTSDIYRSTRDGPFARDFGLKDQIQRASVSVMSNIAEGYERCSPADFSNFLRVAKASSAEVRSLLYVALDVEYLAQDLHVKLRHQAEEVGRIIAGLKASVDRHRDS
jgi:four helix bundle protein